MTRRLAISDIHGYFDRFKTVLAAAEYDPAKDRLHILGDLCDRGPQSREVIEEARRLEALGVKVFKGNHEWLLSRAAANFDSGCVAEWISNGGGKTLDSYGGQVPWAVAVWCAGLPRYYEMPDMILVHAGLRPGVALSLQAERDLAWIRDEFIRGPAPDKLVVFGHTPTYRLHGKPEIWRGENRVGIDTGAAYGGPLTLVDLDTWQTWAA